MDMPGGTRHGGRGPSTPMGQIVSGVIMIVVGFFPLVGLSSLVLARGVPVGNPGILIFLLVFGLVFLGGILSIRSGLRKRKSAKLSLMNQ